VSLRFIHTSLIAIGLAIGLFAQHPESNPSFPWLAVPLVFAVAILIIVVTLGSFALLTNSNAFGYFYWFTYLSCVLAVGIGFGLFIPRLYFAEIDSTGAFVLAGSSGYLVGLFLVSKIYTKRHGKAI
jgi:hypothetical protein